MFPGIHVHLEESFRRSFEFHRLLNRPGYESFRSRC
jgi:hypothetical protein